MTAPHPSTLLRLEPTIRAAATHTPGTPRFRRSNDRTAAAAHVDPFAEIKTQVHGRVIDLLGPRLLARDGSRQEGVDTDATIAAAISEALALVDRPLSQREREHIAREVTADVVGYGPIDQYLHDESVTEVMVNAYDQVWIERDGKLIETNTTFVDDAHVERIIARIVSEVGRRIDEASPMVDARLPDGSRVNAIIPPLALNGPCLTIRKFRTDRFTMADLVAMGTLTERSAQFLELCVRGAANILVSGGTGSGKTTTLNVLSSAIPERERIVTVEDAAEMQLNQRHVISLESRPANIEGSGQVSIRDLVRNTLRMRPDRIIVGECRGGEAVDMLQAMNTGHDGSMTTIHANSSRDALARVETLVLTSGVELPSRAIRDQVSSALHLVVHVSRLVDGSRRITDIAEVGRLESGVITMQSIFEAKPPEDADARTLADVSLLGPLRCTGIKPTFVEHLKANGVTLPDSLFHDELDTPTRVRRGTRPITTNSTTSRTPNTRDKETNMQDHITPIEAPEAGQTMAEYGVVLAVITVVIMATLTTLSGAINGALNQVIGVLSGGGGA